MSKYLSEWADRIKQEFEPTEKASPKKADPEVPPAKN
jgi:hypothetical protein